MSEEDAAKEKILSLQEDGQNRKMVIQYVNLFKRVLQNVSNPCSGFFLGFTSYIFYREI